jgi:hypothetical protein
MFPSVSTEVVDTGVENLLDSEKGVLNIRGIDALPKI